MNVIIFQFIWLGPDKVRAQRLVNMSLKPLLIYRFPLCLSVFCYVCWLTKVICFLVFSIVWILLITSPWWSLTWSSIFCISYKLVFRSRDVIRFGFKAPPPLFFGQDFFIDGIVVFHQEAQNVWLSLFCGINSHWYLMPSSINSLGVTELAVVFLYRETSPYLLFDYFQIQFVWKKARQGEWLLLPPLMSDFMVSWRLLLPLWWTLLSHFVKWASRG